MARLRKFLGSSGADIGTFESDILDTEAGVGGAGAIGEEKNGYITPNQTKNRADFPELFSKIGHNKVTKSQLVDSPLVKSKYRPSHIATDGAGTWVIGLDGMNASTATSTDITVANPTWTLHQNVETSDANYNKLRARCVGVSYGQSEHDDNYYFVAMYRINSDFDGGINPRDYIAKYSTDGVTWTTVTLGMSNESVNCFRWVKLTETADGGYWVWHIYNSSSMWYNGNSAFTSYSGLNSLGDSVTQILDIASGLASNGTWYSVAVGLEKRSTATSHGYIGARVTSNFGGYSNVTTNPFYQTSNHGSSYPVTVDYGNGRFMYAGTRGVLAYSTDTQSWTQLESGTNDDITKLRYLNGVWIYLTRKGRVSVSLNDGISWAPVAMNQPEPIKDIVYDSVGSRWLFLTGNRGGKLLAVNSFTDNTQVFSDDFDTTTQFYIASSVETNFTINGIPTGTSKAHIKSYVKAS